MADQDDLDALAAAKALRLRILKSGKASIQLPDGQGGFTVVTLKDVQEQIRQLQADIAASSGPLALRVRPERAGR